MATDASILRSAATRLGMTATDYAARRACGEKWCYRYASWLTVDAFVRDRSRPDSRAARCRRCASAAWRKWRGR